MKNHNRVFNLTGMNAPTKIDSLYCGRWGFYVY